MINYYFYFDYSDGTMRTYNSTTEKFKTMTRQELYSQKKRYHMLMGYDSNEEGLKAFSKDFFKWVEQLKANDVLLLTI